MAWSYRPQVEDSRKTRSETQKPTQERGNITLISESELRTARQITLDNMEIENLHKKSNDPDLLKVPGFEDLSNMEAQLQQLQAELEAKRSDLADRQQTLESRLDRLEKERKRLREGDAMCESSKLVLPQLEEAVFHTLGDSNAIETQKRHTAIQLHLFNERFSKIWPRIRKMATQEIENLEIEIKELTKGGSNEG